MPSDLQLFQILTQYSKELICLHEPDGRYIFVNEASQTILGYPPEDLIGRNPYELFHPEDMDRIQRISHDPSLQRKETTEIEYRILRADGTYIWLQTQTSIILNSEGEVHQLLTSSRDISKQIAMRKDLEHKERMLQESNRLANVGGWEFDMETGEVSWTEQIYEICEVPRSEQLSYELVQSFFDEAGRQAMNLAVQRAKDLNQSYELDLPFTSRRGNKKVVKIWAQVYSLPGENKKLIGAMQDITAFRMQESALGISERKFTQTFFNSPVGFALVSLDGRFLEVNAALQSFLGYTREEFLSKTVMEVTYKEDHPETELNLINMGQGGRNYAFAEKRYVHKDGRVIWGALATNTVQDENGHPLYFVSQIKNIQERKRAEEILKASNEKLMVATEFLSRQNHQLEEFNQIVSHNLRAPIGNMLMLVDMLEQADTESDRKEFLSYLRKVVENANQTLNELVDVVKIRKGEGIEKQELHFQAILDHTKTLLFGQINATEAEITADFSSAPTVYFPKIYLESIFLNLLSNSLKYRKSSQKPYIQIQSFPSGKNILLSFSDNGLGIDLQMYGHHIFKMHKVFHRNMGGKGLGLFLVKNQMEAMGGEVQVRSVPGQGATFVLHFKQGKVE